MPAGTRGAETISRITGKKSVAREPIFARVMCQGGWNTSAKKFVYEGVQDCRAVMLTGGDKACRYGCLGYGTCERVCPFGAITMTGDHLPFVDMQKCTGCRKCEAACPTQAIEVLPESKRVLVACHSKDKGADTKRSCEVGCIACGICAKICPFDAPAIQHNLSGIDLNKCTVCGICVPRCPTGAITEFLPQRLKAFILSHCTGCRICAEVCPVDAPSGEVHKLHVIDTTRCTGCGICTAYCPVQAIDGTFNVDRVFAAAAQRKKEAA